MALTRRRLLGSSLATLGLLAVGGVGLSWQATVMRTPSRPLKVLDRRSFSILAAVADRVVPGGEGAPTAAEVGVAEQVDALFATMHPGTVAEVVQLLALLENAAAGLVLDGRPTPFTAASPEVQEATLRAWSTSRLSVRRAGYKALRSFCASAYFADPATYASVGYPGPPDFSGALAAAAADGAPTDGDAAADTGDDTRSATASEALSGGGSADPGPSTPQPSPESP